MLNEFRVKWAKKASREEPIENKSPARRAASTPSRGVTPAPSEKVTNAWGRPPRFLPPGLEKKPRRRHEPAAGLKYWSRICLTGGGLLVVAAVRQFVVDQLLELWSRLRARQRAAVDKKRRGSIDTDLLASGLVGFDLAVVFRTVETSVELGGIHPERLGGNLEISGGQLALIGEQSVVERPEFSLIVGTSRGLGGVKRMRMERQREIHVHYANLVAIFVVQLFQSALRRLAERALKIGELDDRDRRVLAALRRMPAAVHHHALGLEHNLHRLALAQAFEQGLAVHHLKQLRFDLVVWRGALSLIFLIEGFRLGVGHAIFSRGFLLEVILNAELVALSGLLDQILVGHRFERLAPEIEALVGNELVDALLERRTHLIELRLDLRVEIFLADFMIADRGDHRVGIVGPCARSTYGRAHDYDGRNCGNGAQRGFKTISPWLIRVQLHRIIFELPR